MQAIPLPTGLIAAALALAMLLGPAAAVGATAPTISSPNTAQATIGVPFSFAIITDTAVSYTATGLPPGLTINTNTGIISGTPTGPMPGLSVTIGATNPSGTTNQSLNIGVVTFTSGAPTIALPTSPTSGATVDGAVGTPFSYTIPATGATSFTATPLPAGLTLDATSGAITGTPTAAGATDVAIAATNGSGTTATQMTIRIGPAGSGPPSITSPATAHGTDQTPFSFRITTIPTATSYTASPLPAGLSFTTSTGVFTGIPTSASTGSPYNVTVQATNAAGAGPTQTLVITIDPKVGGTPTISGATTATGVAGSSFSYTIPASSATSFSSPTTLPTGLTLSPTLGTITGTPTVAGIYNVTVVATNGFGNTTTQIVLTINPAPGSTTSGTATGATAGTTGSTGPATISGNGGGCGLGGSAAFVLALLVSAVARRRAESAR